MLRRLTIAAVMAACMLAVAAVAAGAAAWWVQRSDPVALAGTLARQVESLTGRTLRIDGPVDIRVFPRLRVVATGVSFANARWSSVPDMLRAGHVEAEMSWLALLRGEVRISRLVLDQVDAMLETDARGNGNWVMQPAADVASSRASAAADDSAPLLPGLGAVWITQARLRWRSGVTRVERRLDVERLSIVRAARGTDRVELDGSLDGQAFRLAGTGPDSGAIRSRSRAAPVDIVLSTEDAKVSVRGRFALDRDGPLDLRVQATVERWTALSRLAGKTLSLPSPIGLEFRATGRAGAVRLDPLVLRLGKDALRGSASWQAGSDREGDRGRVRPRVALDLAADAVDLSTLANPAPAAPGRDRRLFPETPLPFALIAGHDVAASLRVARLRLRSGLEIVPLAITAGSKQGRASLQAAQMQVADGRADLSIEIDASAARPLLRLRANGSDLSLEKLTAAGARARITGGSTMFTLDYSGTGSTLRALAASATGEFQVSIGPARIGATGLDFGGDLLVRLFTAINPFHATDRTTALQCAAARLPARAGLVTVNRSIAYETQKANVVAAGRIDLRNETLDLVIRPSIKEGLGVGPGQLAQLVRVTGPLHAPGLALDASGALRAAASVGGAVATGGLSLIGEALLGRRASDPSPCRTALSDRRGSARAEGAAAPPAADPARRVIDGARRLLNLGR